MTSTLAGPPVVGAPPVARALPDPPGPASPGTMAGWTRIHVPVTRRVGADSAGAGAAPGSPAAPAGGVPSGARAVGGLVGVAAAGSSSPPRPKNDMVPLSADI